MNYSELIDTYQKSPAVCRVIDFLSSEKGRIEIRGFCGSMPAVFAASVFHKTKGRQVFILPDKEDASYFYTDLNNLISKLFSQQFADGHVHFFPDPYEQRIENGLSADKMQQRVSILNLLSNAANGMLIVTYPEALAMQVSKQESVSKHTFSLKVGEKTDSEFLAEFLAEYEFQRTEFVFSPGQFATRGGITDVFSYAYDYPIRIEFSGDEICSLRTFDPVTQLSVEKLERASLLPDLSHFSSQESLEDFFSFVPKPATVWIKNPEAFEMQLQTAISEQSEIILEDEKMISADISKMLQSMNVIHRIEFGTVRPGSSELVIELQSSPQPPFQKNFTLLSEKLFDNQTKGYTSLISSDNSKQFERLYEIFDDLYQSKTIPKIHYHPLLLSIHEGFTDHDLKIAWFTDHQIFDRHHRHHLKTALPRNETLTLKELTSLKPGDYITHIDHGIGRFAGLEKVEVNGRIQEAIRLMYKDNDLLYVNIQSLHRISKYVGKDGVVPKLHRLGGNAWVNLKEKTKRRVKEIAIDLIKLYAERKSQEGFAFSPDNYMQTELEASFIYEDTPDQLKSTNDVKRDMESPFAMDRLVCGDVGFGKTEIAIRAAFKAVCDSKQVAVLVPTTLLALQHYKTFRERLKDFPCSVDYVSRFRSAANQKRIFKDLSEGKLDIIIGTHKLIGKEIEFKNLGLLVIDEEQKFGVAAKEKIKSMKVDVDTLTLTATPIPRTLQFSMMGARDLSIIATAPPNRFPIQTEVHPFNPEIIQRAIKDEVSRDGQVFFIHNRVQNIEEIAGMIRSLCPGVRVGVGHGQMEGHELEKIMIDFIDGEYDVLVSTTIVESGLDIPNANTIIIHEAHMYGLSDLHQMRGRVGRSNKKAYCYLIAPPWNVLTSEARRRLQAIEEFSDLGSGFNIAMRDLDIRGAGNLLGAEQSGFINEMGYETYLKILDEAIMELKEESFDGQLTGKDKDDFYVRDCMIETDLEILIPDDYVSDITERLSLYKELDNIDTIEGIERFRENMKDRFGPIPQQTIELTDAVLLRKKARSLGFAKLVLKSNKLIGYFVPNEDSAYFQTSAFTSILEFVKENPAVCRMNQSGQKLTISVSYVRDIKSAMSFLQKIQV